MMGAVQRAAEAARFIPPNVPALGLIAPDFSALRFLPPELPSVAAHLQTISAHIQVAFRDRFAKFALEWKESTA